MILQTLEMVISFTPETSELLIAAFPHNSSCGLSTRGEFSL